VSCSGHESKRGTRSSQQEVYHPQACAESAWMWHQRARRADALDLCSPPRMEGGASNRSRARAPGRGARW